MSGKWIENPEEYLGNLCHLQDYGTESVVYFDVETGKCTTLSQEGKRGKGIRGPSVRVWCAFRHAHFLGKAWWRVSGVCQVPGGALFLLVDSRGVYTNKAVST